MKSWRLNWALREVVNAENFSKHRETLRSSLKFWFALVAKLVPNVWSSAITLQLTRGGAFDVSEFMTLYIYKEIFVDGCYDEPQLSRSDPVIIDVGANTGLFAIRMRQLYPRAMLNCYEPMPANFRALERNLKQSGIEGCKTFQEGVGGRTRAEKLYIHDRNVGGHSIHAAVANNGPSIAIELVDIEIALDRLGGRVCNLLKLDCEGAEYEILTSLGDTLAHRIERIVFEPTPTLYKIDDLKRHLESIGYRVHWNNGIYVAVHRGVSFSQVAGNPNSVTA
jgi:FkbM family methyltransferase